MRMLMTGLMTMALAAPVWAQEAAAAGPLEALKPMLPLVAIFVIMYFLMIRPQQKKQKEHQAMISQVRRGDRVLTSGGILGTVHRVDNDHEAQVEIADGVVVTILRSTIAQVIAKPEPVASADTPNKPAAVKKLQDKKKTVTKK